jgi:hypothetical protein
VATSPAQPISGSAAKQPQRTEAGAFHMGISPLMVGFSMPKFVANFGDF